MAKRDEYEKKTEELIQPILDRMGFELYDVEYVKEGSTFFLRAYIDKPGGITIEDCVAVSREMNEILDREDYIADAYTFEVSSPGLGRPFKKDKDFERNLNMDVEVKTYAPIDGAKEFVGRLLSYNEDSVTLGYDGDETQTFSRSDIAVIRQSLDF